MNRVEKARRAAGMTQQAAAAILGVSAPTYIKKEQNPRLMTFGELELLGKEMDAVSRTLLYEAPEEVDAQALDDRKLSEITLGEYCGLKGNDRLRKEYERTVGKFFTHRV